MFRLEQATARYGSVVALDATTVEIARGERVALVGPSGAGKSTMLHLLNGTLRSTSGKVHAFGKSFEDMTAKEVKDTRCRIGFVHQQLHLVPNVRVIQNVVYGRLGRCNLLQSLRMTLHPSAATCDEVYAVLERVGVADKMYHRTDQLSGGQQQRVALARSLFQKPDVILADEPISSVDPARAKDVISLLTGLCEEEHFTLIASMHNLELAKAYFPRLIGLRKGEVLFDKIASDVEADEFSSLYDLQESDRSVEM